MKVSEAEANAITAAHGAIMQNLQAEEAVVRAQQALADVEVAVDQRMAELRRAMSPPAPPAPPVA